jgi:hypothetical protein
MILDVRFWLICYTADAVGFDNSLGVGSHRKWIKQCKHNWFEHGFLSEYVYCFSSLILFHFFSLLILFYFISFYFWSTIHYRFQEISERVMLQKKSDAEKFVKREYLADGTHSSDIAGSIDEATFPL